MIPEPSFSPGSLRILPVGCGDEAFSLMADEMMAGGAVIFLCGDNRFSPDLFVRRAREAGRPPHALLSRLLLSRAFTIHQLLATVRLPLERELARTDARMVVLTGLVPLFLGAAVPLRESRRVFCEILHLLTAHSLRGIRIVLPVSPPLPETPLMREMVRALSLPADFVR